MCEKCKIKKNMEKCAFTKENLIIWAQQSLQNKMLFSLFKNKMQQ